MGINQANDNVSESYQAVGQNSNEEVDKLSSLSNAADSESERDGKRDNQASRHDDGNAVEGFDPEMPVIILHNQARTRTHTHTHTQEVIDRKILEKAREKEEDS